MVLNQYWVEMYNLRTGHEIVTYTKRFSLLLVVCLMIFCQTQLVAGENKKYRGTIIVSNNSHPNYSPSYDGLVEAYKRYQPDVEVLLELKGAVKGSPYTTWLNAQIAAGNPRPDIVTGDPIHNCYVNYDYYRETINPYTGNRWEDDYDFDFYPIRSFNGEYCTLSTQSVHIMWFYNKDVFDKLGLETPKTWRQFIDVCAKLKAEGYLPMTMRFGPRYYHVAGQHILGPVLPALYPPYSCPARRLVL